MIKRRNEGEKKGDDRKYDKRKEQKEGIKNRIYIVDYDIVIGVA